MLQLFFVSINAICGVHLGLHLMSASSSLLKEGGFETTKGIGGYSEKTAMRGKKAFLP